MQIFGEIVMSDTFDHYADAIDSYLDWDGEMDWMTTDPNPYMPNIGDTPQDVARLIGTIVRGCGLSSGASVYVGTGSIRLNTLSTKSGKCKVTCKHCKQSGLQWVKKDGGWRLYTDNFELHSCYKKKQEYADTPKATEVFKKGNYSFTLGSDDERDWWKVGYKGTEIGRVLWNNGKWQMYAHQGVPENVVQSINSGFCGCLNEVKNV
jgi:hypothetical protein